MKESKIDLNKMDINEFKNTTSLYQQHVEKKSEEFREKNEVLEEFLTTSAVSREKAVLKELLELKQKVQRRP